LLSPFGQSSTRAHGTLQVARLAEVVAGSVAAYAVHAEPGVAVSASKSRITDVTHLGTGRRAASGAVAIGLAQFDVQAVVRRVETRKDELACTRVPSRICVHRSIAIEIAIAHAAIIGTSVLAAHAVHALLIRAGLDDSFRTLIAKLQALIQGVFWAKAQHVARRQRRFYGLAGLRAIAHRDAGTHILAAASGLLQLAIYHSSFIRVCLGRHGRTDTWRTRQVAPHAPVFVASSVVAAHTVDARAGCVAFAVVVARRAPILELRLCALRDKGHHG
jgi:hypothetical protein